MNYLEQAKKKAEKAIFFYSGCRCENTSKGIEYFNRRL